MHAFENGNDARTVLQEAFEDVAQQDRAIVEKKRLAEGPECTGGQMSSVG